LVDAPARRTADRTAGTPATLISGNPATDSALCGRPSESLRSGPAGRLHEGARHLGADRCLTLIRVEPWPWALN